MSGPRCSTLLRLVSATAQPLACAVSIASASATASAQTFLDFHDVPIISTTSPATFSNLFSFGHCRTIRALLFGDSQETCPGGMGSVYVPRLSYELWRRYGNSPETPLVGPLATNGGGQPWADWLVRNSNAGPGFVPARLPDNAVPPSLACGATSTTGGNNINNNQLYGGLFGLQHDAANINPETQVAGTAEFFKRGSGVYMDILAATNPSSGEVNVRVSPAPSAAPNYFLPTTSLSTLSMGLQQPRFEIKRQRIGPLSFAGQPYMQVELSGSDPGRLTDIVGARFVSSVDPRGWSITSFSHGGYQAQQFLQFHAGCGPILAAVEPTVAMLAYGANEFSYAITPQQFRSNLLTLIGFIRANTSSDLPIILLAEADRSFAGSPAGSAENFDQLAGVLYSIAMSVPNVCAVNGRLLTDQHGWSRNLDLSVFLADDVHYNGYGARLKAQLEIDALYSAFATHCIADLDDGSGQGHPDCGVDIADLLFFLAAFEQGATTADLDDDGDPASSNPDGAVDINDLLYFLARFEIGC